MKISKKMMPLAVLVAVVVLLAIALAVLSGLDTEEETACRCLSWTLTRSPPCPTSSRTRRTPSM